ncbi:unnamed protein product [Colias eurytheme]|nr:unnamed protein product [Colias eurytheme]
MSLPSLETFGCSGESTSVGVRWERWKRASLTHFGGLDLQEIPNNIPGANVEPSEGVHVFKVAITKLDSYFAPQQSKLYERQVFRLLKQEPEETFEKFLGRLRKQADKCKFTNKDEYIIDQITEKCHLSELRKKILCIGDEITLDRVITEAKALEVVSKQLEEFKNPSKRNGELNKVDSKYKINYNKPKYVQHGCGRCGNPRHAGNDTNCPARNKECLKCGLKGHFRQYCRTRQSFKRKGEMDRHEFKKSRFDKKKIRDIDQVGNKTEVENEYVFHHDSDAEIDCIIGGVKTSMLIGSACKQNLITEVTWETLKKNKINVYKQHPNPAVSFVAYGSTTPLKLKGSFKARVEIGPRFENSTFYVVINGTRNILGKTTAMALGVLKIGLDVEVNQVH